MKKTIFGMLLFVLALQTSAYCCGLASDGDEGEMGAKKAHSEAKE